MRTGLKQYFAYTYYRLKALGTKKKLLNFSFENIDELREHNIVGFRTGYGLKKYTISYIKKGAAIDKFVLNHLYKKQVIYNDGGNVVKLPLETAHLLNLSFKKDEQLNAYVKGNIKVFYTEDKNSGKTFFVLKDKVNLCLTYLHSLQNYCTLIKTRELDFSLVL